MTEANLMADVRPSRMRMLENTRVSFKMYLAGVEPMRDVDSPSSPSETAPFPQRRNQTSKLSRLGNLSVESSSLQRTTEEPAEAKAARPSALPAPPPASPPPGQSRRDSIERASWDWAWPWARVEAEPVADAESEALGAAWAAALPAPPLPRGPGPFLQGAAIPNSPARRLSEWRRRSLEEEQHRRAKNAFFKLLESATEILSVDSSHDTEEETKIRNVLKRLRLIPSSHGPLAPADDDDDDVDIQTSVSERPSEWSLRKAQPQMKKARRILRDIERALDRTEERSRIKSDLASAGVEDETPPFSPTPPAAAGRGRASRRMMRLVPAAWPAPEPVLAMSQRRRSSLKAEEQARAIRLAVQDKAKKLAATVSRETLTPERLTYSYVLRKIEPLLGETFSNAGSVGNVASIHSLITSARGSLAQLAELQWEGADADVEVAPTGDELSTPTTPLLRGRRRLRRRRSERRRGTHLPDSSSSSSSASADARAPTIVAATASSSNTLRLPRQLGDKMIADEESHQFSNIPRQSGAAVRALQNARRLFRPSLI